MNFTFNSEVKVLDHCQPNKINFIWIIGSILFCFFSDFCYYLAIVLFVLDSFQRQKKNHYASNDDRKFFSVDACALLEQLCTLRMTAFDDRIKLKFINISLFIYFFAIQTLISMLYNSWKKSIS